MLLLKNSFIKILLEINKSELKLTRNVGRFFYARFNKYIFCLQNDILILVNEWKYLEIFFLQHYWADIFLIVLCKDALIFIHHLSQQNRTIEIKKIPNPDVMFSAFFRQLTITTFVLSTVLAQEVVETNLKRSYF